MLPPLKLPLPKKSGPRQDGRRRLTDDQREEIRQALTRGEKQSALAARYGVTRATVSIIKRRMDAENGDPAAIAALQRQKIKAPKKSDFKRDAWKHFSDELQRTTPAEHGLTQPQDDHPDTWDVERAVNLGKIRFETPPPYHRTLALLEKLFPAEPFAHLPKPLPPTRVTMETISSEFQEDQAYVDYVTSELYWNIQQREYEIALNDYRRRRNRIRHRGIDPPVI